MREGRGTMLAEADSIPRAKFETITHSDPNMSMTGPRNEDELCQRYRSTSSAGPAFHEANMTSLGGSPTNTSPWNQATPFSKTSWVPPDDDNIPANSLIGSLTREIYSLVAAKNLLYTGTDSKNIRGWKNLNTRMKLKHSLWIKHSDAVSYLSMSEEQGLLYSASRDRKFKVWRISDSKWLESIQAQKDAVNAVVPSFGGMFFTGSADRTVEVLNRERKGAEHTLAQTLLQQECAVKALAINTPSSELYCGSSEGPVSFWELEKQLSHDGVLKEHKQAVLCFAASGNLVFSGSADKTICVWRMDSNVHTCLSVLTEHTGPVKCLAVEKDQGSGNEQRWIAYSGSLDKSVEVWSVSEFAQAAAMQQNQQHASYGTESIASDGSHSSSTSIAGSQRKR